jgi:hypothetical protein
VLVLLYPSPRQLASRAVVIAASLLGKVEQGAERLALPEAPRQAASMPWAGLQAPPEAVALGVRTKARVERPLEITGSARLSL